jgi:hypothetical protein
LTRRFARVPLLALSASVAFPNEIWIEDIVEIAWTGPYGWPKYEAQCGLPPLPDASGVYLMTIEYLGGGNIVYGAGLTRRPFNKRFREHTRHYMNGDSNILDAFDLQKGLRNQIWHGWTEAPRTSPQRHAEFETRKSELHEAVHRQISAYRLFVADLTDVPKALRIHERMEAAIMKMLSLPSNPFCHVPDTGLFLSHRRSSETPIHIVNRCGTLLLGFDDIMVI